MRVAVPITGAAACAALLGCAPLQPVRDGPRIVSVDYCADQMLLGLVPRARVAAVSTEAATDAAFAGPLAAGLRRVRPSAEEVLSLRPTLVVRSYGGGPRFEAAMRRAGVAVYTLPYAARVADIGTTLEQAGAALGVPRAAARRRNELEAAIVRASHPGKGGAALYVTPGDVTTGSDSLVADLLRTAGYRSYVDRPGWHRLPLERLAGDRPNLVVRGFFDSPAHRQDRWAASGHALLARSIAGVATVDVPGSELACGNWRVGRALDRLRMAR